MELPGTRCKNLLSSLIELRDMIGQRNQVAFILAITILVGVGVPLAAREDSKQVVPRFQEFLDPDGAFANLNQGGRPIPLLIHFSKNWVPTVASA